jgi:HD superfamily phosphohydrolase
MHEALSTLKSKGHKISLEEEEAALIAILLHDIGHGPFSHALENSIVQNINHEDISYIFMNRLNELFDNKLKMSIDIFSHSYKKNFLSQLVSSQLDMDRLDYLKRDSFFTGVSEGIIGTERIIKMLDVADDELVVEAKGIYSLEKFIVSRRIMYWQVYLHKTVLAAENMLIKILKRARLLTLNGSDLFCTPALKFFLTCNSKIDFITDSEIIDQFSQLDDFDIFTSIKVWKNHPDKILSTLCRNLAERKLFRCEIQAEPFEYFYIEGIKSGIMDKYKIGEDELEYFFYSDTTSNYAYKLDSDKILIRTKSGKIVDFADASDQIDARYHSKAIIRHFICYPKDVDK